MDLRFKLVSSIEDTKAVPLAAISAPELDSSSITVTSGDADKYRRLNGESVEYNEGNKENADYYKIPIKSAMPDQAALYSDSIVEDILLGPVSENLAWEVPVQDVNNEYLRVFDIKTNKLLPHKLQYSSNGSTWTNDNTLPFVRILFAAEDLIDSVPMVTYASITASGIRPYYDLITPTKRFTDFSIVESIGTSSKARYSLRFNRTLYKSEFGTTDDVIVWQNNPLSNIDIIVPRRRKTQAWTFQVKKASEIIGDIFISTANLLGSRPAVVTNEVPSRITPGLLQVSQRDLKVLDNNNNIIDLHTNWTDSGSSSYTGIHLTINGKDKNDLILSVNEENGYILLKKPVAKGSSVLIDYAVDTSKWVEIKFDMNPGQERNPYRAPWIDFDIDDSAYNIYLRRNSIGPDIFIGPTARLNRLYPYSGQVSDPLTAADYIVKRPEHISLATLSIKSTKQAAIIDVRRPGGGLKKEDQTNTKYDIKSHTDLGFYDGLPIYENIVIFRLPLEVYKTIYNRYITSDSNTRIDKTDVFSVGSQTLTLSKEPHFNYTLYDWMHNKWDTPQLIVDVTDTQGNTVRAIDKTNYSNLLDTPVMPNYVNTGIYMFYYLRGKIHLNSSSFDQVQVSYKYVDQEVLDDNAHSAASDYIHDSIESFLSAGTFYVIEDTLGRPYPIAQRKAK